MDQAPLIIRLGWGWTALFALAVTATAGRWLGGGAADSAACLLAVALASGLGAVTAFGVAAARPAWRGATPSLFGFAVLLALAASALVVVGVVTGAPGR
jgi:hypothetical protein